MGLGDVDVFSVADAAEGVAGVGGGVVDLGEPFFFEKELADVGDGTAGDFVCARVEDGVVVGGDVDVGGAAGVPAGEDGGHLDDAVFVGEADAAEVGESEGVFGGEARVGACGVARPKVDVDVGDGFAGVDVDDLDVEEDGDANLALTDIFTDELLVEIYRGLLDEFERRGKRRRTVWSSVDFWSQNASNGLSWVEGMFPLVKVWVEGDYQVVSKQNISDGIQSRQQSAGPVG